MESKMLKFILFKTICLFIKESIINKYIIRYLLSQVQLKLCSVKNIQFKRVPRYYIVNVRQLYSTSTLTVHYNLQVLLHYPVLVLDLSFGRLQCAGVQLLILEAPYKKKFYL